jgi:sec-independent protein translocase protein TatC
VSGYCGLLLGSPVILYEIIAFVIPGLTRSERRFLGPIVLGSSSLFYAGLLFSYSILTPAALNFFVSYAEGVVESLWSIDQYFEFVLVLMFSTGLSFQVRNRHTERRHPSLHTVCERKRASSLQFHFDFLGFKVQILG